MTRIPWVINPDGTPGEVWNPIRGCSPISEGCANCYAAQFATRFSGKGQPYEGLAKDGKWTGKISYMAGLLNRPTRWKKPRTVFVNSMGDLFHKRVPCYFIHDVFDTIYRSQQHTFQILTKRADRLDDFVRTLHWPSNVWLGVTVESSDYLYRLWHLRQIPAPVRFVSFEPLIGPIPKVDLRGIHLAIVGCESGPNRRPFKLEWAQRLRDQCEIQGVKFFFKQALDKNGKVIKLPLLDGKRWNEMPG